MRKIITDNFIALEEILGYSDIEIPIIYAHYSPEILRTSKNAKSFKFVDN